MFAVGVVLCLIVLMSDENTGQQKSERTLIRRTAHHGQTAAVRETITRSGNKVWTERFQALRKTVRKQQRISTMNLRTKSSSTLTDLNFSQWHREGDGGRGGKCSGMNGECWSQTPW